MTKKLINSLAFICMLVICQQAYSQKVNVTGTVVDSKTNLGIPGVSILVKGAKGGRPIGFTKSNGTFSVEAVPDSVLLFSDVRYEEMQQKVKQKNNDYTITMTVKDNPMKDVVVVGYQDKERQTFTGAATILTSKDIQDVPAANVVDLLQGKVAGLNVQNNNGTPGMMGTILLRGISNVDIQGGGADAYMNPTSPLFVIDGVPVDPNTDFQYGFQSAGPGISPLSLIPVEDIDKIEVLKDAQATSLYGSKGAYGVILITTKRGNSEVPIIRYSGKFFMSSLPIMQKVIAGKGERALRIQEVMQEDTSYANALDLINSSDMLADSLNPYYNNATNWQSIFYRTTYNETHNISASGGNQKFNYSINANYYDQSGVIVNTGYSRYALSMNAQYRPSDKLSFYAQINSGIGINSKGSGNSLFQTGVATAGMSSSLLPSPSLYIASNEALGAVEINDQNKTGNLTTNLSIQWQPIKGISASSNFSYSYNSGTENTFTPSQLNTGNSKVLGYNSISTSIYNRNSLSFVKTINKKHNFSMFFSDEINVSNSRTGQLNEQGTANDQLQGGLGYNWPGLSGSSGYSLSKSVGLSGDFSYNFMEKYVADFSYRLDGTSTNGPDASWTKNPSVGIRWNINKEKFMQNFKWLDYASLRGSWGRNIVPSGSVYDIYGQYQTDGLKYNNSSTISINMATVPNQYLVPSTTTQWNGGFDIGILNNRVSLSVDAYYKQADKLLRTKGIPTSSGFASIYTNETSIVDYGYEFTASFRPLSKDSKLQWTLSGNAAINHDLVAHLPDNARQLALEGGSTNQPTILRLGSNSLENLLYGYTGVYTSTNQVPVDPNTGLRYKVGGSNGTTGYFQAGDPIWVDVNGDYILDQNDLVIVGNFEPIITGGISSYLQYGPFSMNISASFTLKRDLLNDALANMFQDYSNPFSTGALVPITAYSTWQKAGQVAIYPNALDYTRSGTVNPFRYNQTLFLEDGSYLTINSITLAYNVNRKLTEKFGITSLRVYGTASNLYTFSTFNGPNAQMASSVGIVSQNLYPTTPNYTFGLDIQF